MNKTIEIPTITLAGFAAKMNKLVAKATKLGCGAVGYTVLGNVDREITRTMRDGDYKQTLNFTTVEIFGAAPKFAGWSLIGRLDFVSVAGATVRAMVPGHECPVEFQSVEAGRCDHCGTSRKRNDSFLCSHEDGRVVVVGRKCIADFLGGSSPESIANLASCLADIGSASGDDEFCGGGRVRADHEIGEFLAITSYCIRTYGWVTRSAEAASGTESTATHVSRLLCEQSHPAAEAQRQAELAAVSAKDGVRAQAALAWARATVENSDYIYNLRTVCSAPTVAPKMTGIAASAISAWDRAMARETERRAPRATGTSTHQGVVGGKLTFDGEVVMVRAVEGEYGTTTILKLVDASGNVYTWFASGGKDVQRGEKYTITGTVKKHDAYQTEKQTVLTRCKLVEVSK